MQSFVEKRNELVERIKNMIEDFDAEKECVESLGGTIYSTGAAYRYDLVELLKEAETVENSQDICDLHDRLNEM